MADLGPSPPADIRIREAQPGDLPDLAALEADSFRTDRISRRSLAALIRSPSARVLVAQCGAALAGYAAVLLRRNSRTARLYSLAVAAEHGRKGIGACLLAATEAAATARGADRLRLEVRADNAEAIRLYQRQGYHAFGRRDGYYEDGMAAIRLERRVAPPAVVGRAA